MEGPPQDGHARFLKFGQSFGGAVHLFEHTLVQLRPLGQGFAEVYRALARLISHAVRRRAPVPANRDDAAPLPPVYGAGDNAVEIVVDEVKAAYGGVLPGDTVDVLHLMLGRPHPC
jgi:hypothetical protein